MKDNDAISLENLQKSIEVELLLLIKAFQNEIFVKCLVPTTDPELYSVNPGRQKDLSQSLDNLVKACTAYKMFSDGLEYIDVVTPDSFN